MGMVFKSAKFASFQVSMLTEGESHVPAHPAPLEPADGETEEDWMRSPLRLWFRLHTEVPHKSFVLPRII